MQCHWIIDSSWFIKKISGGWVLHSKFLYFQWEGQMADVLLWYLIRRFMRSFVIINCNFKFFSDADENPRYSTLPFHPPHSPESVSMDQSSFILQQLSPLTLPHLPKASPPPPIPVSPVPSSSESSDSQGGVHRKDSRSERRAWGPQRMVELHRNPGENLGISVIGTIDSIIR